MGQGGHLAGGGAGVIQGRPRGTRGGRGRPGRLSGAETKLPRRKGSRTLRQQRGGLGAGGDTGPVGVRWSELGGEGWRAPGNWVEEDGCSHAGGRPRVRAHPRDGPGVDPREAQGPPTCSSTRRGTAGVQPGGCWAGVFSS